VIKFEEHLRASGETLLSFARETANIGLGVITEGL